MQPDILQEVETMVGEAPEELEYMLLQVPPRAKRSQTGNQHFRADQQGVHLNCSCECDMVCKNGVDIHGGCSGWNVVYDSLTSLWESILCKKDEYQMWHKRECLLGECQSCGIKLLKICPLELNSEVLVKWKSIGSEIVGYTEDGLPKKAPSVQYRETKPSELFEYLKPRLNSFRCP